MIRTCTREGCSSGRDNGPFTTSRPTIRDIGRCCLRANAAAIGLALTSIIVGLFGYVVHNNLRLSREIESRIAVEQRLNTVIRELNHRVKNMLAVIQSIVVRSLRSGTIVDEARDLIAGRLHAMSHAISLLTETEWQGISLRDLFCAPILPSTAHITVDGPDILIGARAAQALSLLLFELASNARKFGALSTPQGAVKVRWSVDGAGKDAMFRLCWEEIGGKPPADPHYSGFGHIVLDRVAPDAIRGQRSGPTVPPASCMSSKHPCGGWATRAAPIDDRRSNGISARFRQRRRGSPGRGRNRRSLRSRAIRQA